MITDNDRLIILIFYFSLQTKIIIFKQYLDGDNEVVIKEDHNEIPEPEVVKVPKPKTKESSSKSDKMSHKEKKKLKKDVSSFITNFSISIVCMRNTPVITVIKSSLVFILMGIWIFFPSPIHPQYSPPLPFFI